ncbi:haloacid dehalogenase [Yeosuana aromativorans]|uniref:Haloacid dehalogenase n=1 Tax=Yeosuana aromativorans TaxID=288019 RepID=A0A8J3BK89_9FLAO|nr:HAD-IA family hydrolase [Yeosuana aromativorans]GGK15152.1 haloacid dehalogenase [Yeosuana aromativorans]
MIKNLVFDFGNVFLNIDIDGAIQNTLNVLKLKEFPEDMIAVNSLYEQGLIATNEFIDFYADNFNHLSKENIIDTWNFMLKDFPPHRLDFLKNLKKSSQYKLFLLSNTNELHIDWVKKHIAFYEDFKNCFHEFYLSHEIKLRKPNDDVFKFVLNENNIQPENTLFIDDNSDNTNAAKKSGYQVWNINPENEDVTTLFNTKKDLF